MIRGIKRYYGEKVGNPKQPITLKIRCSRRVLETLVTVFRHHSTQHQRYVAWSGFLRCGEFTLGASEAFNPSVHLTRSAVTFLPSLKNPTHVRLDIPASKTDPFRKGVSILLAAAPGATTCPVYALKHLFDSFPSSLTQPLFPGLDIETPMRRKEFISHLKSRLTALGIDSTRFSGHSFRRGAATAAAG